MSKLQRMKERGKEAGRMRSTVLVLLHTGCLNIRSLLGSWPTQPHTSPDRWCRENMPYNSPPAGEEERIYLSGSSGLVPTDQFALIKICSLYQAREVWGYFGFRQMTVVKGRSPQTS